VGNTDVSNGATGEVGFLGLGAMGTAILARLTGAGYDVAAWNRTPKPGATATLDEVLGRRISFSILADDVAVEEVLTVDALAGPPGRVHVCMSSISPEASTALRQRCEEAGVDYLSAPVLGRPQVAAAGQLNVLVGGQAEVLAQVAHLFSVVGRRTWHVSPEPQVANVIKLAVNYAIIHSLQAIAESTALAEAYEVAAPQFAELLVETLFGGVVHRTYADLIARRAYRPAGFTVPLGAKDLRLARAAAAARGLDLPSASVLDEIFAAALQRPGAVHDDWASIAEVTRTAHIDEEKDA